MGSRTTHKLGPQAETHLRNTAIQVTTPKKGEFWEVKQRKPSSILANCEDRSQQTPGKKYQYTRLQERDRNWWRIS